MKNLVLLVLITLFLASCNQGKQEESTDITEIVIHSEKLPKKTDVDPKAQEILKTWPEYNALETSFDALYNVKNNEDLSVFIEDLVEKQKLLEESQFPETFDTSEIKSRLKVFKTYILQVKANMGYGIDTTTPLEEMVKSYNAINNQFKVTINSNLDTKLLLGD